jgi:hypothetical protein
MKRSDFLRSFVKGGVLISTGGLLRGKLRILRKWDEKAIYEIDNERAISKPGEIVSAELQFLVQGFHERTEAEFKEVWETEMDMVKEMAWPSILAERNKLLSGVNNDKA